MNRSQQNNVLLDFATGKLAPQNVEAEIYVLGAIMINSSAIYDVMDELQPEYFYKEAHQHIYTSISNLIKVGDPIDLLTVTNELRKLQLLEFVGGPAYIASLTNEIASSANIEVHARIIKENFIKRQLITKSSNIIQTSYGSADMGECLDVAEEMIDSVTNVITSNKEVKHISKNSDDVIGDIEKRKYNFEHDIITAIPTGLRTLDYELYGGWQKSDMIIIGGRPGMGKTAMIIKFVIAAAESGLKVVLFELEMSKKKIYERMLAAVTLVEPRKIKSGDLTEQEVEELIKGKEYLDNLPIYIDESTNLTVLMLKAKIRRLKAKGLCDIVFLDYLQLLDFETGSNKNYKRHEQVAAASRQLKIAAKEQDVPIIACSQLSRASENTSTKEPTLKDLRESGAIEQDADIVIFPHRPAYYKEPGYETLENGVVVKENAKLIIAKYREGGVGEVGFTCNKSLTKITDYSEADGLPEEFTLSIDRRINRFKNKEIERMKKVDKKDNKEAVKSIPLNIDFDNQNSEFAY